MWGAIFFISFLLMFVAPVPFFFIMLYAWWKTSQQDERAEALHYKRNKLRIDLLKTTPQCQVCGSKRIVSSSSASSVPAQGIRSFQFPMEGVVIVQRFTCLDCGVSARYGVSQTQPEHGWIMLDRYMGGW